MKRYINGLGIGILAMVLAAGCSTTGPKGRGKLCIDVYGKRAGDTTASVFVNGVKECDVSMVKGRGFFLFCPAGKHTIMVKADGFAPHEKTIHIKPSATTWTTVYMKHLNPKKVAAEKAPADK